MTKRPELKVGERKTVFVGVGLKIDQTDASYRWMVVFNAEDEERAAGWLASPFGFMEDRRLFQATLSVEFELTADVPRPSLRKKP